MIDIKIKIQGNFGNLDYEFNYNFKKGVTSLLGNIGTGKSTIVNSIVGFNNTLCCSVTINGKNIHHKKKLQNNLLPISIMFQDRTLIPNMTAKQNILFAQKRSSKKNTISQHLDYEYVVEKLKIRNILSKYPRELSGGQQQLITLCRTFLIKSDFIILDEPMSALDIKNKSLVLSLIREVNKKNKIPILIISHSIEEIIQISDHLIIIDRGKIIGHGNFSDMLFRKNFINLFGKFESSTLLRGKIIKKNKRLRTTTVLVKKSKIILPGYFKSIGEHVRLRIRARDILIGKNKKHLNITENNLIGKVLKIESEKNTAFVELLVGIGDDKDVQNLAVRTTKYQIQKLKIKLKDKIYLYIKSTSFDRQAII